MPLSRPVDRWIAFCGGRPATDGWVPTRRYRVTATVVMVLFGANVVVQVAQDRGTMPAVAVAALLLSGAWALVSGRRAGASRFAQRHPYLDASWSIPLAAVFALAFLPQDWPNSTLWALGVAYVALVFLLTWRRIRRQPGVRGSGGSRP